MPDYHGTVRVTFTDDFDVEADDEEAAIKEAEANLRAAVESNHPLADIEEVEVQDISED